MRETPSPALAGFASAAAAGSSFLAGGDESAAAFVAAAASGGATSPPSSGSAMPMQQRDRTDGHPISSSWEVLGFVVNGGGNFFHGSHVYLFPLIFLSSIFSLLRPLSLAISLLLVATCKVHQEYREKFKGVLTIFFWKIRANDRLFF